MPIYEYQCSKCSEHFEKIVGLFSKGGKVTCPKCGDPNPQRIVSSFTCGGSKGAESGMSSSCGPKPSRFS